MSHPTDEEWVNCIDQAVKRYQGGLYFIAKVLCDRAAHTLTLTQPESHLLIAWCLECSAWCGAKWSVEIMKKSSSSLLHTETL